MPQFPYSVIDQREKHKKPKQMFCGLFFTYLIKLLTPLCIRKYCFKNSGFILQVLIKRSLEKIPPLNQSVTKLGKAVMMRLKIGSLTRAPT